MRESVRDPCPGRIGPVVLVTAIYVAGVSAAAAAESCGPGAATAGEAQQASWDFFTNYGNYMPRVECLRTAEGRPDWPWIIALISLTIGVITGYLVIYAFWRRCYLAEEKRDRNEKLMQLAYIFILCSIAGYGFSIVIFFWPVYRLLALVLIALNVVVWKFVFKLKPFELSFQARRLQRQLNEQLAHENDMLEAKNVELIRMRDDLAAAVDELASTNQELDHFAYAASHDLKSPLRAIHHLAEFIAEDLAEQAPANTQKDLAMLQSRVRRMERMLDGLLQYSRVARHDDCVERCLLSDVVDVAVMLLNVPPQMQIEKSGLNIELSTPRAPLEHVIRNLVDNAIKHHDRNEGRIVVAATDLGDFVEIRVTDDGPGIAPKYQDGIFTMFQTLKRRDEVESTGIGLAMVKRTICKHGGQIEVESEAGDGATLRFTWPKHQNRRENSMAFEGELCHASA